jgi:hypothetical protein
MKIRIGTLFIRLACLSLLLANSEWSPLQAQQQKWLRVSKLHNAFTDYGSETEGSDTGNLLNDVFSWPGDYGLIQYTLRGRAMWIGCRNFDDPVAKKVYSYKVIGVGPRGDVDQLTKIFVQSFRLIGQYDHPRVYVDDQPATDNDLYDQLDEVDPNLVSDRMLVTKINTSMGITVTKKVIAFTQQFHDNYYIYDYVFKNTGIVDADGTVKPQTLQDCVFFFQYRYALPGEALPAITEGWAAWSARWGKNTVNHVIGTDPLKPGFLYRAHYSWYGPDIQRAVPLQDDWGCPDQKKTGVMGAAKYVGCVVLHADKSAQDKTDDPYQPSTTASIGSDSLGKTIYSQYDELGMTERYTKFMTRGHNALSQAEQIEQSGLDPYTWVNSRDPGGYSANQGFGPYTLAPGDSIHLVLAEGVAGIDREKNREVGANWLSWFNKTDSPTLILPDGKSTTDYTGYKAAWVKTGIDSILKTYRMATELYDGITNSGSAIPKPPLPPEDFNVRSGGDRISLSWSDNAGSWPDFDGYVIYRSKGNVMVPETVYEKIFECGGADAVNSFDDITAQRGFLYYYYIQTKARVSSNTIPPGVALRSSLFMTVTNKPASLRRMAGTSLDSIRIVPNPYNIKSRILQFSDRITGFDRDQIMFYGIPGQCTIRIFTERGDLIWLKNHTNGSGDESWNSQTMYGQVVVSGIYIVHFQTPKGESIVRKLVVIR